MLALITGASSGLGKDLAILLSEKGYDLILVSRNEEALRSVKEKLKTNVEVISLDLSKLENVKKLYEITSSKDIDILINNAGFGKFGQFINTDLDSDLNMIDLNIKAVHSLCKLYLKDMIKKDRGRILNVSSIAAFEPGPLMSTYYATKSYVYSLSGALYEELRRKESNVHISVLCPGPFKSNFLKRANVKFMMNHQSSYFVAKYALNKMFKNKFLIVPGFKIKVGIFMNRILPRKLIMKVVYKIQKSRESK